MQKIDRTGETKIMNCGMRATILEYANGDNITVQFEDGEIVFKRAYKEFVKGSIKHPHLPRNFSHLRIGEEKIMNCGMKAKIIEYKGVNNVTVQFENGIIKKNKRYSEFNHGEISNVVGHQCESIDRTGENAIMNCGLKATIVEFKNSHNITVQFEDGLLKKTNYGCFKKGMISHSEKATNAVQTNRLSKKKIMNNGLLAKIIKYKNKSDIDVQFEDGEIIKNRTYGEFLRGTIATSQLRAKGISHYHGFECQVILKNKKRVYYKVKHEDGFEGIMTPQEMIAYNYNCQ